MSSLSVTMSAAAAVQSALGGRFTWKEWATWKPACSSLVPPLEARTGL